MTNNKETRTQPDQQSPPRRKPGESWQGFVERQIQEAQARGEFDNLPGHGKPLPLEALNPYEGPNALAHKILRDHGFAPEWIELDKEIRRELKAVRHRLTASYRQYGPDTTLARFAEQIAELNDKITLYNLKAPAMQFQRRRIDLANEIQRVELGGDVDD
jgi:DnaJ family protein C protein 28